MHPLFLDPVFQTCLVGFVITLVAGVASLYLWLEDRGERYLLYWSIGWLFNTVRWVIHYPAEATPLWRIPESLLGSGLVAAFALGAYHLLPTRPWRFERFAWALAGIFAAYIVVATLTGRQAELGYSLGLVTMLFAVGCFWRSYTLTRMSGYAVAAAALLCHSMLIFSGLLLAGRAISNFVLLPLMNVVLAAGFLLIAYQRARQRSHVAEHTLQQIFDMVPIPIAILRPPRGELERVNQTGLDLIGKRTEDLAGNTTLEAGLIFDNAQRQAIYAALARGETITGQELTLQREDGEKLTYALNGRSVDLGEGMRHLFALYDLTGLRRAERELLELNRSLEDRVRQRTGELEAAVRDLESFSYSVSHDLRAPLRAITMCAQFLQDTHGTALDAEARSFITRIERSARRMDDLIVDLLEFSSASRKEFRSETVDMRQLVGTVLADLDAAVPPGAVIEVLDLPAAQGDASLLRQVWLNLIGNALKYSAQAQPPRITIGSQRAGGGYAERRGVGGGAAGGGGAGGGVGGGAAAGAGGGAGGGAAAGAGGGVGGGAGGDSDSGSNGSGNNNGTTATGPTEYYVRDNGAGFDMAYADKLFRVFQRLHTASQFEGTGIGLAIVDRVVQRHGGSVRAEGAVGKGAVFYFTLGSAAGG